MYDDSSIKISKEDERINEIERLKRKFNKVNYNSSMSCENNSDLNTSMVTESVQNSTSFENVISSENKQQIIDTNKSINLVQVNNLNRISQVVNKIDQLIKLKSGNRKDEIKSDNYKKFQFNFNKNTHKLNRKESDKTLSSLESKGKSFKFQPEKKAQQKNNSEINKPNHRSFVANKSLIDNQQDSNNKITKNDNNAKIISTGKSGTINNSNIKSNPTRNLISILSRTSKSNYENSLRNTVITNKTDSTQILQINNIHTDKFKTSN